MYTLIIILIILASLLMVGIVLIQESKGGGLASGFSSSNQIMGVRKTADFLEKATWWLAIILVVLSLAATISIPRHTGEAALQNEVSIDNNINPVQQNAPTAPVAETPAE